MEALVQRNKYMQDSLILHGKNVEKGKCKIHEMRGQPYGILVDLVLQMQNFVPGFMHF